MSDANPPTGLGKLFTIGFWILIGIAAVATVFLTRGPANVEEEVELRNYRMIDSFALTDQHGETVRREDLEGKVWIANFVFTSCNAECIVLSHRMGQLQERFAENPDVAFVSISVDPQTDTPARLSKYAERYGAGPRWIFLTGDTREVDELIKGSFLLPIARNDAERSKIVLANLIHSERLAVVDRLGVVRYYTDGMKPDAVDKVSEAVERLLPEGGT